MPRKTTQPDAPKRPRGRPSKAAQIAPALPFDPLPDGGRQGDRMTKGNQIPQTEPFSLVSADAQDVDLVRQTLRAICGDKTAPAAARAQAARTLAELANALGRNAPPPPPPVTKPLAQMTRAELEAELARLGG